MISIPVPDPSLLTTQQLREALDARITELKERIDRGEGSNSGAQDSRSRRRLDSGLLVSIISSLIAILSVVTAIVIGTR